MGFLLYWIITRAVLIPIVVGVWILGTYTLHKSGKIEYGDARSVLRNSIIHILLPIVCEFEVAICVIFVFTTVPFILLSDIAFYRLFPPLNGEY